MSLRAEFSVLFQDFKLAFIKSLRKSKQSISLQTTLNRSRHRSRDYTETTFSKIFWAKVLYFSIMLTHKHGILSQCYGTKSLCRTQSFTPLRDSSSCSRGGYAATAPSPLMSVPMTKKDAKNARSQAKVQINGWACSYLYREKSFSFSTDQVFPESPELFINCARPQFNVNR
jgi:hypothetical protein